MNKNRDMKIYTQYMRDQVKELLTNYGKIDYLWFDGCGSEGHEYDKKRIVQEIFRLQPEILTFCDPEWTPCVRWVGNEDGYGDLNNPLVVSDWDFSEQMGRPVQLSQSFFLPSECDCKIRDTWFFDNNEHTLKSVDELFGMYESSVGRGSNFLLNVGPDNHGLICDADKARLLALGDRIKSVYRIPAPYGEVKKEGNAYSVTNEEFSKSDVNSVEIMPINRVVIREDISNGQSVKAFNVYAHLPHYQHKRILVYAGKTIGHKVICPIFTIRSPKLTVEIVDSDGEHQITEIKGYFAK